jgi:hypothetical protein
MLGDRAVEPVAIAVHLKDVNLEEGRSVYKASWNRPDVRVSLFIDDRETPGRKVRGRRIGRACLPRPCSRAEGDQRD